MESDQAAGGRSLLAGIGLLMVAMLVLGLAAMISAMVVARANQGMAAAVNQSGTLRMQSYRIAAELADSSRPLAEREARVRALADELEQRLANPRLTDAIPGAARDPRRLAYARVARAWRERMRPALSPAAVASGGLRYRAEVDDFVAEVHHLVRVLEERSERRIRRLGWMQAAALVLTLVVAAAVLWLMWRRVARPLRLLLASAEQVRQGDFSGRVAVTGADELGRLGRAMNRMTGDLQALYGALEARIAEQTREVVRSHHSLQLLYRTSRTLAGTMFSDRTLGAVLDDFERELKLASVRLCLLETCRHPSGERNCSRGSGAEHSVVPPSRCAGPGPELAPELAPGQGQDGAPHPGPCARCVSLGSNRSVLALAVADSERRYGTLWVTAAADSAFAAWQPPLLEALAAQLATALNLRGRVRESRRLALYQERSILARELHDSLAQSLSYLKIQALRLDAVLQRPEAGPPPRVIVGELRDGIGSAYRQLRELLKTFRLRIDGEGLSAALTRTLTQIPRSHAPTADRADPAPPAVALEDRLPPGLLTPNEEVHVLQIVREALANAIRHGEAAQVRVRLTADAGSVRVDIEDDGCGIEAPGPRPGHYGVSIMRERARSLGGDLCIDTSPGGGTLVRLEFRARAADDSGAVHELAD